MSTRASEYYRWSHPPSQEWSQLPPLTFPTEPTSSPEEARARYVRVKFAQHQDEALHFSQILRRGWYPLSVEGSARDKGGLITAARLMFREGADQLHLSLQTGTLTRELAPADWLDLFLESQSIEILHRRAWLDPMGLREECLGLIKSLGQPWVTRLTAFKDGNRIFYLRAWCSLPLYERFAEDLYLAVNTFELTNPTGALCVEECKPYVFSAGEAEQALAARAWVPDGWKPGTVKDEEVPLLDQGHELVRLVDADHDSEIFLGLLRRPPGLGRLELVTTLAVSLPWTGGTLRPEPVLEGPYEEGPAIAVGHYHELEWRAEASPDGGGEVPPTSASAPPLAVPPPVPVHVRLYTLGTHFAWFWLAWRPPTAPEDRVGACIGRRTLEIVLGQLELGHPLSF